MMVAAAWVWGFIWLVSASFSLWPWVNRWLAEDQAAERQLIRWPLTVGLSLGALTLWMLVAGFWRLNGWIILAFPIVTLILRFFPPQRTQRSLRIKFNNSVASVFSVVKKFLLNLSRGQTTAWLVLAGLIALLVVLAQSTYYPFIGEDEISRYAYYARLMFVEGRITNEVRGYPLFLPLAYAYVFFVTNQIAEQLARLIPATLSAMTVFATGALGWRWYGPRGGWAAAFALIATPLYLRWSPDGYIDIPSALYFVLTAYTADVWLTSRRLRWALLAGALAGLALWTKQAGFIALAGLGVMFAWVIIRDGFSRRRAAALTAMRDGLFALAAAFACGGWWYIRNALYDGWANAVPGPGQYYYQLAVHNLASLLSSLGEYRVFGIFASLIYMAGVIWGIFRLRQAAWPLIWAIPYTLLWWQLFSYDGRFLLTVLPFYALLFGGLVAEMPWQKLESNSSKFWQRAQQWGGVALIMLVIGASIIGSQLGGLRQWLVAPTATYAERLYRAKGDLYPTVEFIRDHVPASARIVSMDGRLRYYLIDRSIDVFYPAQWSALKQYDYFVVGSWWTEAYPGFGYADSEVIKAFDDPTRLEPVYAAPAGRLSLYRIVKP